MRVSDTILYLEFHSLNFFVLEDADNETLTTASVSRVAAVFDQITESMIQEAQNQAMQLIQKTENELNEKFLKTNFYTLQIYIFI